MNKLSGKEKEIALKINYYFLKISNFDVSERDKIIKRLGIKSIKYSKVLGIFEPKITITLSSPGMFIGKKGIHFDKISKLLNNELKEKLEIVLLEDELDRYLYQ